MYVSYDVTDYLHEGKNAVGLWLGYGWFRPAMPGTFHDSPVVKAQLDMTYEDRHSELIVTDSSWKCNPGPLSVIGLHGERGFVGSERYDATHEIDGWSTPDLEDSTWRAAAVVTAPEFRLSAQMVEPNRIAAEVHPVAVRETSPGIYEVDMGKSYAGLFQLRMHALRGDRIEMEMFEHEADSGAKQSYGQHDTYIAKGATEETFRNHFDYRAFRYVTIRGLKSPPALDDIRGYLVCTAARPVARFECSSDLVNRIQQTVDWTYRCTSMGGNIVDCPHRERLGYGAEGQATMLTAMTNYDTAAQFTHWLQVWRDEQNPVTGMMMHTAPSADPGEGSPGWGGICITLPWELYVRYGDRRILKQSYPTIRLWLQFLESKTKNHILQHYGAEMWGFFADWVAPGRQIGSRWTNAVPKSCDLFFNNCYYIHNLEVAARIARVLGKESDALAYEKQAALMQQAVDSEFYDPPREAYVNGEQGYQAIALWSHVVPEKRRARLSGNLAQLITEAQKGHLNTGVLGTFYMLRYLQQENRNDLVFQIVDQHSFPGWGWLLDRGATTIGEQWGGRFSQIHTSFLSIGSWFIEGLGGIQPDADAPGYKHFIIRPGVVGDLRWASASYKSIHGLIESRWKLDAGKLTLAVTIPPNTTATVYVPSDDAKQITEHGAPPIKSECVKPLGVRGHESLFLVESGTYEFVSPLAIKSIQ
jgi:alpha-L-rhamnosidase